MAFAVFLGIGLLVLYLGRNMDTHEEEERNGERTVTEFFFGPPGYFRAVTILAGAVCIVVGVCGLLYSIFA